MYFSLRYTHTEEIQLQYAFGMWIVLKRQKWRWFPLGSKPIHLAVAWDSGSFVKYKLSAVTFFNGSSLFLTLPTRDNNSTHSLMNHKKFGNYVLCSTPMKGEFLLSQVIRFFSRPFVFFSLCHNGYVTAVSQRVLILKSCNFYPSSFISLLKLQIKEKLWILIFFSCQVFSNMRFVFSTWNKIKLIRKLNNFWI